MEIHYFLIVGGFLVLLAFGCYGADLEVRSMPNTGLDLKSAATSNDKNSTNEKMGGSEKVLDSIEKDKDHVARLKNSVVNDLTTSNSSEQQEPKEAHNLETDNGRANGNMHGTKETSEGKSGKGSESKEILKENKDKGTLGNVTPLKKENTRGEDCDTSNKCTDEENKLVACLRVPGNESPGLSLLIQNKGKGPLTVMISAPDYVQLEETKIQLQEKENKKVKVSITSSGTNNSIVLVSGNGRCHLDFKDLLSHISKTETDTAPKFKHIFLKRTPFIAFVFLASLLVMVSATWICIRYFPSKGYSKYQKLETELPVSVVSGGEGKAEAVVNDGWDDSWDDNWDDEEAPKTPSLPVTPSLSSKGLASRRLNKEGWKD